MAPSSARCDSFKASMVAIATIGTSGGETRREAALPRRLRRQAASAVQTLLASGKPPLLPRIISRGGAICFRCIRLRGGRRRTRIRPHVCVCVIAFAIALLSHRRRGVAPLLPLLRALDAAFVPRRRVLDVGPRRRSSTLFDAPIHDVGRGTLRPCHMARHPRRGIVPGHMRHRADLRGRPNVRSGRPRNMCHVRRGARRHSRRCMHCRARRCMRRGTWR